MAASRFNKDLDAVVIGSNRASHDLMLSGSGMANERQVNERQVKDTTGRRWLVRESSGWVSDEQTACLIASCEQAIRRIWTYPAGWTALPDALLVELINAPVVRRYQSPPCCRAADETSPPAAEAG